MVLGRRGVRFQEEGREWILTSFLYADDLVLCGESETRGRWWDVLLRCVGEEV